MAGERFKPSPASDLDRAAKKPVAKREAKDVVKKIRFMPWGKKGK
jgi:hypothetical protein